VNLALPASNNFLISLFDITLILLSLTYPPYAII